MQKPKRKALNHSLYINHSDLQMERWSSWYVSCRDTAWLFSCIDFRSPIFTLKYGSRGEGDPLWRFCYRCVVVLTDNSTLQKEFNAKILYCFNCYLFIGFFLCGSGEYKCCKNIVVLLHDFVHNFFMLHWTTFTFLRLQSKCFESNRVKHWINFADRDMLK